MRYQIIIFSRLDEQFQTIETVNEVESVYNLTERDFDDLKLYHLGPCRALPSYLLNPQHWEKVLPEELVRCRGIALERVAHSKGIPMNTNLLGNNQPQEQQQLSSLMSQNNQMRQHPQAPVYQHNIQQSYPSGYSQLPYPPTPGSVQGELHAADVQQPPMQSTFNQPIISQQFNQGMSFHNQQLEKIPEPSSSNLELSASNNSMGNMNNNSFP